jgi:hypothetical protein
MLGRMPECSGHMDVQELPLDAAAYAAVCCSGG